MNAVGGETVNSWVTNEKKATKMNNDIITEKQFNGQAVIKRLSNNNLLTHFIAMDELYSTYI